MLASVQIIVKIRLFSILLMLRYVHEYITVMDSKNSWLWKEFRVFRYEREDTEYIPNEFIQCILNAGPLNFTRMCMEMRSVLTRKQYKKKTQYILSLLSLAHRALFLMTKCHQSSTLVMFYKSPNIVARFTIS